jgi:tetratricopeptide (TPR) repeat protein
MQTPASARLESCSVVISESKGRLLLERAFNLRGRANLELRHYEAAVKDFSNVIQLSPRIAGYYTNRQNASRLLGRLDEALADANIAVRLAPTDAFVFESRANLLTEMRRYGFAEIDYTHAIELAPLNAGLHVARGKMRAQAGRWSAAVNDFSRAQEIEPNYMLAIRERSSAYQKLNNFGDIKSDLSSFLNKHSENSEEGAALAALEPIEPPLASPGTGDADPEVARVTPDFGCVQVNDPDQIGACFDREPGAAPTKPSAELPPSQDARRYEGRSVIAEAKSDIKADFGSDDLDRLHFEYKVNQARFMRAFKGRTFEARMKLHRVKKHIFSRETYSVAFGKAWSSDVGCEMIDEKTTELVINKNKGDVLQVKGIIQDHTFGAVQLTNCVIKE